MRGGDNQRTLSGGGSIIIISFGGEEGGEFFLTYYELLVVVLFYGGSPTELGPDPRFELTLFLNNLSNRRRFVILLIDESETRVMHKFRRPWLKMQSRSAPQTYQKCNGFFRQKFKRFFLLTMKMTKPVLWWLLHWTRSRSPIWADPFSEQFVQSAQVRQKAICGI